MSRPRFMIAENGLFAIGSAQVQGTGVRFHLPRMKVSH